MVSEPAVTSSSHGEPPNLLTIWSPPDDLKDFCEIDSGALAELIRAYQADITYRLQKVREAVDQADFAALGSQVHSMKGSSKQMAAHSVASACEQIEAAGPEPPVCRLTELVKELRTQVEQVVRAMADYQP